MKVLIYGSGIMGMGICQTFIQNNHKVFLYNKKEEVNLALLDIERFFDKCVFKGKISVDDKEQYLSNITVINSLDEAKDVDLAIEAVIEDIEIKKQVLSEIDKSINENVIIATNTSSLSITELAVSTRRPEKVVGMHFFNPAPIMELVEVIIGMTTSIATVEYVRNIAMELKKKSVLVEESPGFIVNRMLIPMINEAIAIYSEGIATIEDIDTAMKSGANHPIGPLALADLIGLDVCLKIMDVLHSEFGLDKYSAHPLLRKMVRANKLGKKTKKGFYSY